MISLKPSNGFLEPMLVLNFLSNLYLSSLFFSNLKLCFIKRYLKLMDVSKNIVEIKNNLVMLIFEIYVKNINKKAPTILPKEAADIIIPKSLLELSFVNKSLKSDQALEITNILNTLNHT